MPKFTVNPEILRIKSAEIINQGEQFGQNAEIIFQIVDELINSNCLSPEEEALAREIKSYKDDLNKITKMIGQYGIFFKTASNKVIKTQEDIIAGIN